MVVAVKVSGVVSFPSYGKCSGAGGPGCEGGGQARVRCTCCASLPVVRRGVYARGRYLRGVRSPFSQGFAASAPWCSGRAQRT